MVSKALILALLLWALAVDCYPQENPATEPVKRVFILDLTKGRILGAQIGMDEATARSALKENHFHDLNKVSYPNRFLLQVANVHGLALNFRGNKDLNDIYTNSPEVVLSNGLKVAQPIGDFDAQLGKPTSGARLPSNIGNELVYPLGDFELGVIVLDRDPGMAKAMTLRKRSLPATHSPASASDLVELMPEYPKPLFISEQPSAVPIPNLEKPDPDAPKGPRALKVPRGTRNMAKNKRVNSSDPLPIIGTLDLITDGVADGSDGCYVELGPGPQWVQIDLGADYDIWKILVWHYHKRPVVVFGVVVQVSDDPMFKNGVTTLFNNDAEGKNHLGRGTEMNYIETNHGRLIEGEGTKARYVRLWSNGNSADEMNRYIEVQVFGTESE